MKFFNIHVWNELFLLSTTSAVHPMQTGIVHFCWNGKIQKNNMREIIATNGFCGVTEVFENSTSSYFLLGNLCCLPQRRLPKTPRSTSSAPHKANCCLSPSPSQDNHCLVQCVCWWVFISQIHFGSIIPWFLPLPRPCVTPSYHLLKLSQMLVHQPRVS